MAIEFYEVASLDEANASRDKSEKVLAFDDFVYDNQTSPGILQQFDDTKSKIKEILGVVENMEGQYTELQNKYDEFTDFNTNMNSYIRSAKHFCENLEKYLDQTITLCLDKVQKAAQEDKTLLDDVETLKDMLGMEADDAVGGTFRG